MDLSSNGRMSAWVRTPPALVLFLLHQINIFPETEWMVRKCSSLKYRISNEIKVPKYRSTVAARTVSNALNCNRSIFSNSATAIRSNAKNDCKQILYAHAVHFMTRKTFFYEKLFPWCELIFFSRWSVKWSFMR